MIRTNTRASGNRGSANGPFPRCERPLSRRPVKLAVFFVLLAIIGWSWPGLGTTALAYSRRAVEAVRQVALPQAAHAARPANVGRSAKAAPVATTAAGAMAIVPIAPSAGFDNAVRVTFAGADQAFTVPETLIVTKTADTNDGACDADCSLREAIAAAAAGDTITFASPFFDVARTITLGSDPPVSGQLVIDKSVTITGPGANLLTVSGNSASRVFQVDSGVTASLSGMTLTGGNGIGAIETATGGAIYNAGTLTVTNCTIINNATGLGGGIRNHGGQLLTVTDSLITGNAAFAQGAGILSDSGPLTITGSTISNNINVSGGINTGGGIDAYGTTLITNSTISGNQAITVSDSAGGIWSTTGATTITACTITGNSASGANSAGGVKSAGSGGTVTVRNSIIAGNSGTGGANPDVIGAFVSSGYNLIGDGTSGTGFTGTADQAGTSGTPINPMLGPLQDNGGLTPTHALLAGSPAIDKGSAFSLTTDQRGFTRPLDDGSIAPAAGGDNSDIGAFEVACTTITCPANITVPNLTNQCGAVVTYPSPTGSCGAINCLPTSGSFFPVGTTTVNCTSVAGPTCAFTVTVQDTQAPELIGCPSNMTVSNDPNLCSAVISYTPPTASDNCPGATVVCSPPPGIFPVGTTTVTCTGSDASPNSPDATCSFTVTVSNAAPVLTYASPQTAQIGQTTNITPATGATDTNLATIAVLSVTPPLGASISVSNTTGVVTVSDTTQPGAYVVTIRATDACGVITDATFTLQTVCPAISIAPATLPDGTVGVAYSQIVTGSPAGPYGYSVSSGALPLGLSLNATTGAISGTPATTGTFSFRIAATVNGCSGFRDYTVAIACPAIAITPPSLAAGQAGVAYSQTLSISPAGSYTFSLATGNLPAGLTLHPATGVISGTPTSTGSTTFTLKAQGAGGCFVTQSYTVVIGCPTVAIFPASLPDGIVGSAYGQTITASPAGGNYTFAVTSGSLPAGLTLNPATGVLSGIPVANGSFTFTVTATGFGGCPGSRSYTVVIGGGGCPTVTLPASLPGGSVGALYNNAVAASPSGIYSYAVTAGSLPPGVTLYVSNGLIFGYPTAAGTYSFTITATQGACSGSQAYTVTIGAGFASSLTVFSDFDGDGKSDLSVFRGSDGNWLVANSGDGQLNSTPWGASYEPYNDVTVSGDYDGDGSTDLAVFRRGGEHAGYWFIKQSSDGQVRSHFWGLPTDIPVPGDYDGDSKTDVAVWRGSVGGWYIVRSSDGVVEGFHWGAASAGDIPAPGDYDGDRKTDFAVFRRTGSNNQGDGIWYVRRSSDGSALQAKWGMGTDAPVPGDYDADGKTDFAVWRASEGNWYIIESSSAALQTVTLGVKGDVPVAGDFDGDGKADATVWRESTGTWLIKRSRDGSEVSTVLGQTGDVPVAAKKN